MDLPLISIAVPVYNTARFLPAALDSLLAQDHTAWECLLWDDGSTDGSGEILVDYAARDSRFKLLGNGRNQGVGHALGAAFEQAGGDLLGWMDSDDVLEPNALSAMRNFLRAEPMLGMAYSSHVEIDEEGRISGIGKRAQIPYSPQRLLVDFMTHHFHLMHAHVYRAAGGFNHDFPAATDYDLCLRLSECCAIGHLPLPLYRYRIRRGSLSTGSRLAQVRDSFNAAQAALVRRGLGGQYALSLGMRARHLLKPKQPAEDVT